jgi:hypothetical protein
MEEKRYPIYLFEASWDQDDYAGNGTSEKKMFKEDLGLEATNKFALTTWWPGLALADRPSGPIYKKNPVNVEVKVTYLGEETWCMGWFSHYTLNTHLSDDELRLSFHEYVDRHRNEELMGAENAWRWKGPCRCEHCQERGFVRIDH